MLLSSAPPKIKGFFIFYFGNLVAPGLNNNKIIVLFKLSQNKVSMTVVAHDSLHLTSNVKQISDRVQDTHDNIPKSGQCPS